METKLITIIDYLKRIEESQKRMESLMLSQKEVFNVDEAALFIDQSKSHVYRMLSNGEIPSYKPRNKKIYFSRIELQNWMLRKPFITKEARGESNS